MTNDIPIPERANAEQAPVVVAEPSMFDAPEWTNEQKPNAPNASGGRANVKFAGVRFQPVGKVYHYIANGFNLKAGDWVVVDTSRGKQMGQVATLKPPRDSANLEAFKHIERPATGRDMAMRHYYENKELEAMIACRAESSALSLPIKIVKAEYSFDGQTLTFLYSSDQEERVETNDLRQVMSRLYRARIETRQVSPREVAKIIGGMGACGIEQRCCSRFLTEFSPISIKHAKEQGLSLNPHDITGMCGRLRCCLIYEYEQYVEARRHLPKKNTIVGTPAGQGKVVDLMPMRDSVVVLIGEGETAKELVVHREQIIPLEELKRLQEKAASGTCDKHEGGGCDCGKDKPAGAAGPVAQGAAASQRAEISSAAADAAQPSAQARSREQTARDQRKKPAQPRRPQKDAGRTTGAQPAPQQTTQRERDQSAPGSHKRHAMRPKHQRAQRPADQAQPQARSAPEAPPARSTAPEETPGGNAQEQSKAVRRPLRRPLPRRSS